MALIVERNGSHGKDFFLRAATGLAAAALAAEVGIIDLDLAFETTAFFACRHGLHQPVLNAPRRGITHPQLAFEREYRQRGFGLTDQVDGNKPGHQPKLCVLENGAGNQRRLMTAGVPGEQCAFRAAQDTMRCRAARAAEALFPASGLKRRSALGCWLIMLEKLRCRQAGLELVAFHQHYGLLRKQTIGQTEE